MLLCKSAEEIKSSAHFSSIEVINIFELIPGWIGAFFILLAFWLLTHKVVHSHSFTYLGLNLAGGVFLVLEGWLHESYSAVALNVIWVFIAIYGLGWAHKRKSPKMKK